MVSPSRDLKKNAPLHFLSDHLTCHLEVLCIHYSRAWQTTVTICLCTATAHRYRMVFTVLYGRKKSKGQEYFINPENYMQFKF